LTEGEDLSIELENTGPQEYNVHAKLQYEGSSMEIFLGFDSLEEVGEFYRENLSHIQNPEVPVYGNSKDLEEALTSRDTWSLVQSDGWAVDLMASLEKYMEENTYEEVLEHTSTTVFAAVALSENFGAERPESYDFYRDLVKKSGKTNESRSIGGKIKKKAADSAKKKTKNAVTSAVEDVQREYRRMEREGEIDEIKNKAKKEAAERTRDAASSAWEASKQKTKEKARKEALGVKDNFVDVIDRFRDFGSSNGQVGSGEAPDPVLKIERDDGVTIYEYEEVGLDNEDSDS